MSKYLLNKFLYTVDRDSDLVEAYRADPYGLVARWEAEYLSDLTGVDSERTTWSSFTDAEREALNNHDYVALFEMGAHPFLTLTLFIALFERDHPQPLSYQRRYAQALAHITLPHPNIAT
jgi:hypothetical protein